MPRLNATDRGYGTAWRKARSGYLKNHPYCVVCAGLGHQTVATVVDHIEPHRGNQRLFWDVANWRALCGPHHNSLKQKEDNRGYVIGCDVAGRPIDPAHPWNKKSSNPP